MEEWRPVSEWPEYDVSSQGRIRTYWAKGRGPRARAEVPRLLKLFTHSGGYLQVALSDGRGSQKFRFVHRLVLTAFSRNPVGKEQGCHNNGDRQDNRAENLRWDTCSNNHADKYEHGTKDIGEKSVKAILTEVQAKEAIALHGLVPAKILALWYGVSESCVRNTQSGHRWPHLVRQDLPTMPRRLLSIGGIRV